MLKRQYTFAFLLYCIAFSVSPVAVAALPGELDNGFDNDGMVVTGFTPYGATAEAVIQQPDGKLVVAGYVNATDPATDEKLLLLARYNGSNGALDTSFSGDGVNVFSFGNGIRASALAQQADGKLLAAGWVRTDGSDALAVVRIRTDGSLDGSFGNGGIATASMGTANTRAFAVLAHSDGTVWVAGYTTLPGSDKEDFAMVRFRSNGELYSVFGSGGGLLTDISNDTDKAYAIIKQTDGKIVLLGEANVDVNGVRSRDFAVVRYSTSGKLDSYFSRDGKQTTSFAINDDAVARAAIQQKDGKLVVVGSSDDGVDRDVAVVRYLQNGDLDSSFSGDGKVLTDFGGSDDVATGVVQQYDGKLLVSGFSSTGGSFLVRYLSNGSLDADFGNGGKLTVTATNTLAMNSMVQQADGQVVVAGYTYSAGKAVVALLRYLFDDDDSDGVVDTADNCRFVINPGQANHDSDAWGDACDDDDDNDGVKDVTDIFPFDPTESIDTDVDGIGNNADPDDDNDSVPDGSDPFPLNPFLLNRVTGDNHGDVAGYSVAMVGDVNSDGFADILVGAPNNDVILPPALKASLDVGSAYLVSGDTSGGVPPILWAFNGRASGDRFGSVVRVVGDVNGDAVPDFAIAAPKADQFDPVTRKVLMKDSGAVTVYSGSDYSLLFTLTGEAAGDNFGFSVTGAGDIDGDSRADILVGAWGNDRLDPVTLQFLKNTGAAYLYSSQMVMTTDQPTAQLHKFEGEAKGDYFGYSVAAGSDLDHDTVNEISIGAYGHDPLDIVTNRLRVDAGGVYVYSVTAPDYSLITKLVGAAKGHHAGFAQAVINNGQDAFADLLIGSPGADIVTDRNRIDAGQVSLFTDSTGVPAYTVRAVYPQIGARFGSALAAAGQVDGAGADEFVVGASRADVSTLTGVRLKDAGQITVFHADNGIPVFIYNGRYRGGRAGFSVAAGRDQNNDNYDDVLIGSPYALFGGLRSTGVVETISGKEASAAGLP